MTSLEALLKLYRCQVLLCSLRQPQPFHVGYAFDALAGGVTGTVPSTKTLPPSPLFTFDTACPSLSTLSNCSRAISLMKLFPQNAALYLFTYLKSFLWFSARVTESIVTASWIASATCCESQGFTTMEPLRLWAAPANSDRIITP